MLLDRVTGSPPRWRGLLRGALPYVAYLVGAVALLHNLWADPAGLMLLDNYGDQVQFEWFLTNGANAIADGENPLFTSKLNAPYGVNLMANTSMLALALPLAPVTLIFGAHVTFVLVETLALAGTASAWFFVLNRLLNHRAAAVIGGAFCGFAPAMISHAAGHPNIAAQYVLPFIVLVVLRLGEPDSRHIRRGLVLAGLVVVQAFINEELLLFTALALGVFLIGYAASRWEEVRPRVRDGLRSLATTTVVAGAALAYPLYHQFFGRGSYHGLPADVLGYGADIASYWSIARRSLGGDITIAGTLTQNPTEENSFFGYPLLLAVIVVVIWLRRDVVVRALAGTGLVFAVLSFGSRPQLGGRDLNVPGPWDLLDGLPLLDSVVPTRLALVVTPVIGCLLAIAVVRYDALVHSREPAAESGDEPAESIGEPAGKSGEEPAEPAPAGGVRLIRLAGLLILAMMVGPLVPTPLPVFDRPSVPTFFTTGLYRDHIPRDGVVLGMPPGWQLGLRSMQWQTATDLDFTIYGGYYLAPDPGNPEKTAIFGPAFPRSLALLAWGADNGELPGVTLSLRTRTVADLRAAGVTTLVLSVDHELAAELRVLVDDLVGPGRLVGDVWLWDVRGLR